MCENKHLQCQEIGFTLMSTGIVLKWIYNNEMQTNFYENKTLCKSQNVCFSTWVLQ